MPLRFLFYFHWEKGKKYCPFQKIIVDERILNTPNFTTQLFEECVIVSVCARPKVISVTKYQCLSIYNSAVGYQSSSPFIVGQRASRESVS